MLCQRTEGSEGFSGSYIVSVVPLDKFEGNSSLHGEHEHLTLKICEVMKKHDITEETIEECHGRLIQVLSQMMFVSGEQAEPSAETTYLIEEIVREQVIEMVSMLVMRWFVV